MSRLAMDQITITDVTDGEKGVSVKIVTPFYTLGTTAPDKPTVNPPESIWTTTEPEYVKGKNLYTTQRTVFEDSTFSYSDVSLDSSYKASEQAITKADMANTTADNASSVATLALENSQELVANGGFETGDATRWGIDATYQVVDDMASAHSGRYYLNAGSATEIAQANATAVIPGHIYRFSGWYRRPSTNSSIIGGLRLQKSSDGNTYNDWNSTEFGTVEQDDWTYFSIDSQIPLDGSIKYAGYRLAFGNTTGVVQHFDDLSFKDITEAKAAQDAADSAQSTAQGAQTTADGKNKIFSSSTQPSSTGLVPGDLWFQLDSSSHVTGIQVWNGSGFVDYVLMANKILVSDSITGDKLAADSIDGMTITGTTLRTTNGHVVVNDTGISATDNSGVTTVNIPADGGTPMFTGGFQTGSEGRRIKVSEENGVGSLQLLDNMSEVGSLRIFHNENGYAYVQLGAGVDGLQIASQTEEPDPLKPSVQISSTYSTRISAGGGANINGTWFADDLSLLPTNPRQVGNAGTIGFAGGVRYVYDGNGSWVTDYYNNHLFGWYSTWGGTPTAANLYTEVTKTFTIRDSPYGYVLALAELGCRFSGSGEYGMRIDINNSSNNSLVARWGMTTPQKNGGTVNYTQSHTLKLFTGIPYKLTLTTFMWGSGSIVNVNSSGNSSLFVDPDMKDKNGISVPHARFAKLTVIQ